MENHARWLALGLVERGHQVIALTTARPGGSSGLEEDPFPTWFLPAPATRYSGAWWRESAAAFARLHAQAPFDLVWSQSAAAIGYLAEAYPSFGVPCVAIMHGSLRGEFHRRTFGLPSPRSLALLALYLPEAARFTYLWRRYGPRLAAAIVPSPELAEDNRHELHLPPERMAIIPLGVDLARFSPDPAAGAALRERLHIPSTAPVLLVVGRLSRQKGVHVALAALQRLSGQRPVPFLLVAGQGREAAQLQRTAERAGLTGQVRFLGQVPHDELPSCYNAADICLFPWLGWEAFPISILEALACGRPVIASRIGSAPSILGRVNGGLLVPPGDARALAEAVGRLLSVPPAERRAIGQAARRLAETEFSLQTMVERTEAVFASCLRREGMPCRW